MRGMWVPVFAFLCLGAGAQDKSDRALPPVTVSAKANPNPVEKSYRKMVRGMDLFEKEHGLSPNGVLRFKLLPRQRATDMNSIELDVVGASVDFQVPIAPDHSFSLPRSQQAFDQDAMVIPNRKAQSMTWRSEIRTPGLAPNTRRLGDLRLECRVGMEAGLVSNTSSLIGRIAAALFDTPAYCARPAPLYLFFADQPLFSVTLVAGARREVLAINSLYAGASDDPGLKQDLPFCDCEVLVDRTYVLPLGDLSWPDDTLVEFEYMDDASGPGTSASTSHTNSPTNSPDPAVTADSVAALGPGTLLRFDSGYEVRVVRQKRSGSDGNVAEFVTLFAPSGFVTKTRNRPIYNPPGG